MQRLSLDRAQDPPLWTLFPNKVSLSLSLSPVRNVYTRRSPKSREAPRTPRYGHCFLIKSDCSLTIAGPYGHCLLTPNTAAITVRRAIAALYTGKGGGNCSCQPRPRMSKHVTRAYGWCAFVCRGFDQGTPILLALSKRMAIDAEPNSEW